MQFSSRNSSNSDWEDQLAAVPATTTTSVTSHCCRRRRRLFALLESENLIETNTARISDRLDFQTKNLNEKADSNRDKRFAHAFRKLTRQFPLQRETVLSIW